MGTQENTATVNKFVVRITSDDCLTETLCSDVRHSGLAIARIFFKCMLHGGRATDDVVLDAARMIVSAGERGVLSGVTDGEALVELAREVCGILGSEAASTES
jgi:hypothetical protein